MKFRLPNPLPVCWANRWRALVTAAVLWGWAGPGSAVGAEPQVADPARSPSQDPMVRAAQVSDWEAILRALAWSDLELSDGSLPLDKLLDLPSWHTLEGAAWDRWSEAVREVRQRVGEEALRRRLEDQVPWVRALVERALGGERASAARTGSGDCLAPLGVVSALRLRAVHPDRQSGRPWEDTPGVFSLWTAWEAEGARPMERVWEFDQEGRLVTPAPAYRILAAVGDESSLLVEERRVFQRVYSDRAILLLEVRDGAVRERDRIEFGGINVGLVADLSGLGSCHFAILSPPTVDPAMAEAAARRSYVSHGRRSGLHRQMADESGRVWVKISQQGFEVLKSPPPSAP